MSDRLAARVGPAPPVPEEAPAAMARESAQEPAPESRRLRLCELALVVGVGFLRPAVYAVHHWWVGGELKPEGEMTSLSRILGAALSIGVLAYVLYRRGGGLRTLGLTFRRSDLGWALLLLVLGRMMTNAVYGVVAGFVAPSYPHTHLHSLGAGLIGWLCILPAAAEEELIVRAFLMTEVSALTGSMALAVLLSVGFQSFYHIYQGVPAMLLTTGGFFVAAVFYAYTRRITPVILAHAFYNFLILARL